MRDAALFQHVLGVATSINTMFQVSFVEDSDQSFPFSNIQLRVFFANFRLVAQSISGLCSFFPSVSSLSKLCCPVAFST